MFRKYDQNQQFLLPLSLDTFVPEDHIARIINDIIDAVDITAIESTYSENGSPAYHPRLMLKILLYGYMINIRSSRDIQKMLSTETAFMFLAAMQHPDFRTICRFRSTHLESIKDISLKLSQSVKNWVCLVPEKYLLTEPRLKQMLL